jgi:16S rRNA (guanine966-N2)-methyltransferase
VRIARNDSTPVEVRIVGGTLRGRKLLFTSCGGTRPMKDRTREALFSRIRHDIAGAYVLDLFTGTGALLFESISRGAKLGWGLEQNIGMVQQLQRHAHALDIQDRVKIIPGDAFIWGKRLTIPDSAPWILFCSPPYAMYQSHAAAIADLLQWFWSQSPDHSMLVVETNAPFSPATLVDENTQNRWETFAYPPALLHFLKKVPTVANLSAVAES